MAAVTGRGGGSGLVFGDLAPPLLPPNSPPPVRGRLSFHPVRWCGESHPWNCGRGGVSLLHVPLGGQFS